MGWEYSVQFCSASGQLHLSLCLQLQDTEGQRVLTYSPQGPSAMRGLLCVGTSPRGRALKHFFQIFKGAPDPEKYTAWALGFFPYVHLLDI